MKSKEEEGIQRLKAMRRFGRPKDKEGLGRLKTQAKELNIKGRGMFWKAECRRKGVKWKKVFESWKPVAILECLRPWEGIVIF